MEPEMEEKEECGMIRDKGLNWGNKYICSKIN
jgi:hypothetical protein